jgi:hypothetical protein
MAYVQLTDGAVTGFFGRPQPDLPGFAEIADDDPRLLAFLNPPPTERDYVMAVQVLLDSTAQERRYDNIASACTYAGDPDPVFDAEGMACKVWRSAVWRACYEALAEVQAGTRPIPTIEDFVASLPKLVWPQAGA